MYHCCTCTTALEESRGWCGGDGVTVAP